MTSSTQQTTQNDRQADNATAAQAERSLEQTPVLESRAPGVILPQALASPDSVSPNDILQLQRVGGNRAVNRLLAGRGAAHRPIQAKLMVGPASDRYEQEADRVAQQVVGAEPVQRRGVYTLPTVRRFEPVASDGPANNVQRKETQQPETKSPSDEFDDLLASMATKPPKNAPIEEQIAWTAKPRIEEYDQLAEIIKRLSFEEVDDILAFGMDHIKARFDSGKYNQIHKLLEERANSLVGRTARWGRETAKTVSNTLGATVQKTRAYMQAYKQHLKDRETLKGYVKEGLQKGKKDKRLANSCEWVINKRTKLYAVTPTHDSAARVNAAKRDPGDTAYFPDSDSGSGDIYSAASSIYSADVTDNTNIEFHGDSAAWASADGIAITSKTINDSKEYVWETIKHEVQHVADRSDDKKDDADGTYQKVTGGPDGDIKLATDKQLELYKTEYRGYNYEGSGDKPKHNKTEKKYGYRWSKKQLEIFEHIWNDYDHTKRLWDATDPKHKEASPLSRGNYHDQATLEQLPEEDRIKFNQKMDSYRAAIVNYKDPDEEGFNKYNSIRVDDFYNALDNMPDDTEVSDPEGLVIPTTEAEKKFIPLKEAVANLEPEDAKYILKESPDYDMKIGDKLDGEVYLYIVDLLEKKSKS